MNLRIHHQLLYQYSSAVKLDPHVLYLHPQPRPYLHVSRYNLLIEPTPTRLVQNMDVEGNVQHIVYYQQPTEQLIISAEIEITNSSGNPFNFLLYPFETLRLPIKYSETVRKLLQPYLVLEGVTTLVDQMARQLAAQVNWETMRFFTHLNAFICNNFAYEVRDEGSHLPPEHTLISRKGSCRDYVALYMAVCRTLGVAARFVSGYYYGQPDAPQYLHAWAEVYLPGAGWRGFDPTQNCMAGENHIPLASSSIPERVTPVWGTYRGSAKAHLLTQVSIKG